MNQIKINEILKEMKKENERLRKDNKKLAEFLSPLGPKRWIIFCDENQEDGKQIIEMMRKFQPSQYYSYVPMSGIPEITIGLSRFIGLDEIKGLFQPCGYCGDSADPNDICDDCFDKMPPAECYCDSKTLLDKGCQCGGV